MFAFLYENKDLIIAGTAVLAIHAQLIYKALFEKAEVKK